MEEEVKVSLELLPEKGTGDFVYYYDRNKKLLDQCIYTEDDLFLLNVRKVYTNNTYFGVNYSIYNKIGGVFHHFRCKDRGFTEKIVDNKESFIYTFLSDVSPKDFKIVKDTFKKVKQNFSSLYTTYFCYDNKDEYCYSLIIKDNQTYRGLYSKNHSSDLPNFSDTKLPNKTDVELYLKSKEYEKTANTLHTVSTEYSSIIIEHKTQYDQIWSDIKRRKAWLCTKIKNQESL